MILNVTFEKTTYNDVPHKFEAGTPDVSGAIGLGLAFDYLEGLGRRRVQEHEEALSGYRRRHALGDARRSGYRRRPAALGRPLLRGRGHPPARSRHRP